ncbi:hypothetical protein DKX38_022724 [Salix brachista]|uniref:Uncharacterized protein n=1 Tax=Salix brachista TaxID=2182728 RepID=A0A5N5K600_9ROSI|nr:hypothetical protein DKX38_022724 [Salix brachista]
MEGAASSEYRKALWTVEEDRILMDYVKVHGKGKWNRAAKVTRLKRCGKSCRLRWINYLSPNIKHGGFSEEEDDLIIRFHKLLGNRWFLIAGRVSGRKDYQVKNHWNTHLSKKLGIEKFKWGSISRNNTEIELQNVVEDSHEKAKEITSTHEPTTRSDFYDDFLLSYDDP